MYNPKFLYQLHIIYNDIFNINSNVKATKIIVSLRFQANCTKQKNEGAYGKVLEVLFSGYFALYDKSDCLSEASYLFYHMSSAKYPEN
jgi:hypothetical protein